MTIQGMLNSVWAIDKSQQRLNEIRCTGGLLNHDEIFALQHLLDDYRSLLMNTEFVIETRAVPANKYAVDPAKQ